MYHQSIVAFAKNEVRGMHLHVVFFKQENSIPQYLTNLKKFLFIFILPFLKAFKKIRATLLLEYSKSYENY